MKLKSLLNRNFLIFFLVANIYLVLSNIPLITLSLKTPAHTTFFYSQPLHLYDYNGYLSFITLGKNDYWLYRNPYSSEKQPASFMYFYYIILGKVASITHVSPPFIYHFTRIITGELYVMAIYLINSVIMGGEFALWGALFGLTGTIALPFVYGAASGNIPWWLEMDALQRLNNTPHHLAGQAFLLIIISLIFIQVRVKKYSVIIIAVILSILTAFIYSPGLIPLIFGLPLSFFIFYLIRFMKTRRLEFDYAEIHLPLTVFLSSSLAYFAVLFLTQNSYSREIWTNWEIRTWNLDEPLFNRFFILSYGLLPCLALPALRKYIQSVSWKKIFICLWPLLPVVLLFLATPLGISKIRLLDTAFYIPLGILAAESLKILHKKYPKKHVNLLLPILFLLFSFATSLSYLKQVFKTYREMPTYTNIFIPQDSIEALAFISKNIPKDSIIFSDEHIGNLIPIYAPVISYFGHVNMTADFAAKQNNVWRFYSLRMTDAEAREFLKKSNISFVYFGPEERGISQKDLPYSFLKPVFKNNSVIIYSL